MPDDLRSWIVWTPRGICRYRVVPCGARALQSDRYHSSDLDSPHDMVITMDADGAEAEHEVGRKYYGSAHLVNAAMGAS